ncbi:CBS domain-containing protein [uncultured Paraglaciecola sp.]|jgi:acetoin utilization protein AcuB|uniref:CBS domain-containing protein n=1 Tax=uncultured Paraglaciecola sp. TaxID=1765024 RepID=UPI0026396CD8|nr:CBS domain-containing protein [uncultured Paraglaciecola sp.]|tara:strand:+ start:854 stop:1285 length:432 start_codon:yes stop_codon:yes gene_type:complete
MLVERIMSKPVVSVTLDDTLRTVKQIFVNAKFHHLLVVENGKLYGVISDRDLLKSISPFIDTIQATAHDQFTLDIKVHQIMNRKPITLKHSADVYEAISLFNKHNISCIPVVNEKGAPIGIISWRDILRTIETNHNKKLSQAK